MIWLLTEILVFVAAAAVFGGLIGLGLAGSSTKRRAAAFEREHRGLIDQLRSFQRKEGLVEAKAAAQAAAEAAARGDLEARLVEMETAAGDYRARAEAAERRVRVLQTPGAAAAQSDAAPAEEEATAAPEQKSEEIEALRAQLAQAERLRLKAESELAQARGRSGEMPRKAGEAGEGVAAPESVTEGERPPGLAGPRNGKADDLRRIKGIGPKNEGVLNSLGLYHYEQIAALTPANIDWLDAYLKFPGRIARDDWVGQAKVLLGVERQPSDKVHPHDAGA